jgi:hypothetical protein
LSFIGEGTKFYPAGIDVGGGEGETKPPGIPFTAVMNGVNLKKAGFPLVPGVMGPHLDMLFQEFSGFVPLMPLGTSFFLSSFKTRSMVEGLIKSSFALTSSVMWKGGHASKKPICSRIRGARSFPHRYREKAPR